MTDEQKQLIVDLCGKYRRPSQLLRAAYPSCYRAARCVGADVDEIDACCYYGMCLAATKYDTRHNTSFDTYAAWWMRSAVTKWTYGFYLHPKRDINRTVSGDHRDSYGRQEWDRYFAEDQSFSRLMEMTTADEIANDVNAILLKRNIDRRKADIFRYRRGFGTDSVRTYRETADVYGISWQAIREIDLKVLDKIKPDLLLLAEKYLSRMA